MYQAAIAFSLLGVFVCLFAVVVVVVFFFSNKVNS